MAGPSPGLGSGAGFGTKVLFEGRLFVDPNTILKNSIRTHTAALAKEAKKRIKQVLGTGGGSGVLKFPTGFYRSQIETAAIGDLHNVTDSGVIYGAWLEGIGSRNSAQGFPGYFTFRKVQQTIERDAAKITRTETAAMVRKLNS